MIIRNYSHDDEPGWVRCRLLSFLDSSYFDDIRKNKEIYEYPSVCLVAQERGQIVGIIDVEYEENEGDVCYYCGGRGAVIWHVGVIPEYRRQNVASKLWDAARTALTGAGITRFEAWTQDDEAANMWYKQQGFELREAYLNAFIRGVPGDGVIDKYLIQDNHGDIYGIRSLNFEAPIECKAELEKVCYRLHEVRFFELKL